MDTEELENYIEQSQSLIDLSPQMDEQNTRRKLIEPLIQLLGWDMLSPGVELEYSVQMGAGTKKVDYALMLEGTPVVFVEAKGLDSAISDSQRRQLKSYMRQTGVDWGLLTNGKEFEILKRRQNGSRPDETSLGRFKLEELGDNAKLLRALSRELIDSGEADKIAKNIEATQRAASKLREKKDEISIEITQVVTNEIGESVSQTVEDGAKQFIDMLAASLEQQGRQQISFEKEDWVTPDAKKGTGWTPREGANAVAGRKLRAELNGSTEDVVALFPTKKSGVEFFKENNAWGFVRIARNPDFVAMYISEDVQQVKYIAEVQRIVPATEAELARPLESYSEAASEEAQAGFDPDKNVVYFEPDSLFELEDPIPYKEKHPQALTYTTLGKLKEAKTTKDLF